MKALMIRGAGGEQPEEPREPVEAPDSLRSIAYANILDLVSEGEVIGWADPDHPMRCYYLNETKLENSDGSRNFKNVSVAWRYGTQTQYYIQGFDAVENEIGVAVELRSDTPWTHEITNLNLTAFRVRLAVLALSQTDTKTGDVNGFDVSYKIELSTDSGSFVTVLTNAFSGKTTTKYERSHKIVLPPAEEGWLVRVSRITANSDSSTIQDTTTVESFTDIIDAKLRMPMSAVVAVSIDASQFNNIPSRAFHWKGRIIKVPTNYDPDTRTYDGIWDGTFQSLYSNNPAWVFYDMILNDRYGLGHLITDPVLVDKWALYSIAQYCDELVDDGRGGQEPRFTCNVFLQSQNDALRVMQDLATTFRGIVYAASGVVMAVADKPEDPVYTYTRANVIDGKFSYTGSGRKVRHTIALVSWNDMNDMGRAKVEYIEDEDGIARYGIQPTEVIAVGCTSQGQARRLGKYILTTERYETDAVSFGVGLDGTFVPPGSIIRIADPFRANRRIGGRIREYGENGVDNLWWVTVDHVDAIAPGNDIVCILPNGLPEVREVDFVDGNDVYITAPFSQSPIPQSVWAIEADDLATQRYRVLGVTENNDGLGYTMNAVQHVVGKFAYIEDGIVISEPPTMVGNIVAAPATVTVFRFERVHANLPVLVLAITWTPVDGADKYEIRWQRNDGNWSPPEQMNAPRYEFDGALPGVYRAKVEAIDAAGFHSTPRFSAATTIETANFTIVNDVAIDEDGIIWLDGQIGEQWRCVIDQNCEVQFKNTPSETTHILEAKQTGNFTLTLPENVTPVSGDEYALTLGGQPDYPKIDTLGFHTDNAGVLWWLRVDKDDAPNQGGGGGPLTVEVSPNPAYGWATVNPAVELEINITGGTAPVSWSWSRGLGGTGDYSGSTGNTGGADFTILDGGTLTPTFGRTGTMAGYVAQNWRILVTDAVGLQTQKIIEITLEDDGIIGGGTGLQCVWAEAWMPDGRRAKDVKPGTRVLGVNPETMERCTLLVSYAKRAMAECYLLRCSNGVELTCSESAPIPTPDGLVLAPDMLGKQTITLAGTMQWTEVEAVVYLGLLPVMHITAQDGHFFAGNDKGMFMAHHNIKWEPV